MAVISDHPRLRRVFAHCAAVAAVATSHAPAVRAQSAQQVSIQFAALFTSFNNGGRNVGGVGVEPQLRFNRLYSTEGFGALSLGIGGQFTSHSRGGDRLQIAGVFVEPRWVPALGSSAVFPYLSGRISILRQSNNFAVRPSVGRGYGVGAGVAVKLSRSVNLDAGLQLVRQDLDAFDAFTTYNGKAGLSIGLARRKRGSSR